MTLKPRFNNLPAETLAAELHLVRGTRADYTALAAHHYRTQRPATMSRVSALRHHHPTVVGRWLNRRDETQTVGVLIESMPTLNCRLREWAMHDRHGSWLAPHARAMLINRELRCISRVIVDPRWRGIGLAVRLVRFALHNAETTFTEALAAMGRVHPFFERAGMLAYHRPPHPCDTRLMDALAHVDIAPRQLAAVEHVWQRIQALPTPQRDWLTHELHRWYRQSIGRAQPHLRDPAAHLRAARDRLQLEPVYYLHDNRTHQV